MNTKDISEVKKYLQQGKTTSEISRLIDIPRSTLRDKIKKLGLVSKNVARRRLLKKHEDDWGKDKDFKILTEECPEIDLSDLLERRRKAFNRTHRNKESKKLVEIGILLDGPIAITHLGDIHLDDPGMNFPQLEHDLDLIKKTKGMYAATVGDTTNNWVGRLQALYADSSTSYAEAWELAEWLFKACPFIYIIGGNHDTWSGAGDPLNWIAKNAGQRYSPHGIRLQLCFPNKRKIIINAKHQFPGRSIWNKAHGVSKSIQMGFWDDIAICGHIHTTGYAKLKSPDGRTCHAIQVATYKEYDSFADKLGFIDGNISPSCTTILNPYAENPNDLVLVIDDIDRAADYLNYMRSRWNSKLKT